MNKTIRTQGILAAVIAGMLGFSAGAAAQESATLNQFRASETPNDGFAMSRPDDLGHMDLGAQLHVDYANDPLVYETSLGDSDSESTRVVSDELTAQVGLAFGLFDRLVIYAGLPVVLWMNGEDTTGLNVPAADGSGLGDVFLGARVRLLGERDDSFGLGLQVTGTFPTGGGAYRGDNFLTIHPELLAEVRADILRITLNAGARFRENQTFQSAAGAAEVTVGDQFTFALGISVPLYGTHLQPGTTRLDLHVQAWGSTAFNNFFDREETPFEALAGLKFHHSSGIVAGLSGGTGLNRGFGSPDFRAIGTIGWTPAGEAAAAPPSDPDVDTDGDGLMDNVDECPTEPEDVDSFEDENGCPDTDNDNDGILDADDQCPMDPEDMDAFEDENGCPDPDNDEDGILDTADECPMQPEDFDQFEDENGCPDPDNDGDGVMDGADNCPLEAGVVANNGCPDADRDGDTVVDRLDNCPDEAGTVANQGCRARQQVVIRDGQLEILDKVFFRTNSDRILSRSNRLLNNVAQVINNHPEITIIRVEGHTDDRGDDDYNMDLSRRRAEAVVAYLIRKDVEAGRLRAAGFGETRAIETNDTREGRAANRRVEFNLGEGGSDIQQQNSGPGADSIDS
ncbi:MAG: OmpA family protein [Polyangiales bacterium]